MVGRWIRFIFDLYIVLRMVLIDVIVVFVVRMGNLFVMFWVFSMDCLVFF